LRARYYFPVSHQASPAHAYQALQEFLTRLFCGVEADALDGVPISDLTFTQFKTILILRSQERALSVHDLADVLGLSLAATGRSVDKLVQAGLVHRREDEHDRRVKRVTLTDEGHAVVETHIGGKENHVRAFVRKLPADLRTQLVEALSPILQGDYLSSISAEEPTIRKRSA
jgi:DNA-binding MarR family transcriptional regulator